MKNLFRNIFLVSCLLLTVGAVEAQAQSLTRVQKPTPAAKPEQKLAQPVNFAIPAPGFNPNTQILSNVKQPTTEAEKRAYDAQRKGKTPIAAAPSATAINQAELARKSNDTYAKLLAYEQTHLKGVDLTTEQGQLKRMEVQKAFYLQNGDTQTAAKVASHIQK